MPIHGTEGTRAVAKLNQAGPNAGPTDTVKLSRPEQIHMLRQQGELVRQIAAKLDLSMKEEVDADLYGALRWPRLLALAASTSSTGTVVL